MEEKKGQRSSGYDSVKGLAIIIVCLGHILQENFIDYENLHVFALMYAVQMPLFMIVSGYFAVLKSPHGLKQWANKVGLRFVAYIIPFLSRVLIFEKVFHINDVAVTDRFQKMLFSSLDSGLWYLYVIFVLYVCLSFSCMLTERIASKKAVVFCLEGLFYGLALAPWIAIGVLKGVSFAGCKFVLYYSVFYFFGHCMRKYFDPIVERKKAEDAFVAVSLLAGAYIACNCDLFVVNDTVSSILVRMTAGIFLSYATIKIVLKRSTIFQKFYFDRIGQYTLEIYYVHGVAFGLMAQANKYLLYSVEGQIQFFASVLLTAVYTTLIIFVLKSNRWTDFLFFGKIRKPYPIG